jgi:hypothetical protein
MACEFFDDGRLARCTAVSGLLIPSHHERERYCRTDGSRECPTFKLYQLHRAPLPQDAYYALWVPPAPGPSDGDSADESLSVAV